MSETIIALISLIALEVILGIDNIIFISILADKLPEDQRNKLRYWGIGLAMIMRLLLLAVISWILRLDQTLFTLFNIAFSGKSLILIVGGLFLLYKSTKEIYHKSEIADEETPRIPAKASFGKLLGEVILLGNVPVRIIGVAKDILRDVAPFDGPFPSYHVPTRLAAAREKFAAYLD